MKRTIKVEENRVELVVVTVIAAVVGAVIGLGRPEALVHGVEVEARAGQGHHQLKKLSKLTNSKLFFQFFNKLVKRTRQFDKSVLKIDAKYIHFICSMYGPEIQGLISA